MIYSNDTEAITRIWFQFDEHVRHRYSHSGEFYHYTSQEGACGILSQTPSFWFTQYDCLNDDKECLDIMEVLKQYLAQRRQGIEFSSDFKDIVLSLAPDHKNLFSQPVDLPGHYVAHYDILECQTYICSFSTNSNSSHLWENYANSGCCLTVGCSVFEHKTLNKGYRINTTRVIYDLAEKFELFDRIILEFYKIYVTANAATRNDIINNIRWFINDFRYIFKRERYKKEEEVRVVVTIPNSPFKVRSPYERKVRNGNIPYIVVPVSPYYFYELKMSSNIEGTLAHAKISDRIRKQGHTTLKII